MSVTGFGFFNSLMYRLEWEYLRQAKYNRAISGNFSIPVKHSLRTILHVGQGVSFTSGIISAGEFSLTENKTWVSYFKLGIGILSSGLTYTPEPITTVIGIYIGVTDLMGGLNGFYNFLDKQEQRYSGTGGL
jgi:hypothetical protein